MQPHGYVSKHSMVHHTPMMLCMKIWAIDESGEYFFKTPGFNYSQASGFLSYKSFDENNNWFKVIKGEIGGVKGAAMFDGGETPNVCITDSTEAIPAISVGDTITISGNRTGVGAPNTVYLAGLIFLNRVKLLEVVK